MCALCHFRTRTFVRDHNDAITYDTFRNSLKNWWHHELPRATNGSIEHPEMINMIESMLIVNDLVALELYENSKGNKVQEIPRR